MKKQMGYFTDFGMAGVELSARVSFQGRIRTVPVTTQGTWSSPEIEGAVKEMWLERRTGKTQRMLEAALECASRRVIIIAHSNEFAGQLARRVMKMLDDEYPMMVSKIVRPNPYRFGQRQEIHFMTQSGYERHGVHGWAACGGTAVFIDHFAVECA